MTARGATLRSPPGCSCQDQGTDASRLALVEQAAGDRVQLAELWPDGGGLGHGGRRVRHLLC